MAEIARILAISRAHIHATPTIPLNSACSSAQGGMVGIMLLRAPDRAKNRRKNQ